MREYPVQEVEVESIKLDGQNPNEMSDAMRNRLKKSIGEFGYTQPIVVDKKSMVVADGEHRLLFYKESGKKSIPCILAEFKSDAHRRAYRQAANKIHGEHREDLDLEEYARIIDSDAKDTLKMATGQSLEELEKMIDKGPSMKAEDVKSIGRLEVKCPQCGHTFKKARKREQ